MININSIDKKEVLRYLQYGNNVPQDNIKAVLDGCEKEIIAVLKPRYLYRIFRIERKNNTIILDDCGLELKGNNIYVHLDGCDRVVLMCATISADVDKLIRTAEISGMLEALVLDSMASSAIEQLCDKVEEEIHKKFSCEYMTWRYSPGYGDCPITVQNEFLRVLDAPKRIGLCATDNSILTPTKSVTAIIGLSDKPIVKQKRGCAVCNMRENCLYRNKNQHC